MLKVFKGSCDLCGVYEFGSIEKIICLLYTKGSKLIYCFKLSWLRVVLCRSTDVSAYTHCVRMLCAALSTVHWWMSIHMLPMVLRLCALIEVIMKEGPSFPPLKAYFLPKPCRINIFLKKSHFLVCLFC